MRYSDERIMRRRSGDLFWCRVRGRSLTPDDPVCPAGYGPLPISQTNVPSWRSPHVNATLPFLRPAGLTSKEIGRDLGLSYRTIEVYRARLLEKFGARKLPELVAKLTGMPL